MTKPEQPPVVLTPEQIERITAAFEGVAETVRQFTSALQRLAPMFTTAMRQAAEQFKQFSEALDQVCVEQGVDLPELVRRLRREVTPPGDDG